MFGRFARFLGLPGADTFWPPPADKPWRSTQRLPDDLAQIGVQAQRLLDDPVLQEALTRIEVRLSETWRHSALGEPEQREAAYRMYWAVQEFRAELRRMLGDARARERRQDAA